MDPPIKHSLNKPWQLCSEAFPMKSDFLMGMNNCHIRKLKKPELELLISSTQTNITKK